MVPWWKQHMLNNNYGHQLITTSKFHCSAAAASLWWFWVAVLCVCGSLPTTTAHHVRLLCAMACPVLATTPTTISGGAIHHPFNKLCVSAKVGFPHCSLLVRPRHGPGRNHSQRNEIPYFHPFGSSRLGIAVTRTITSPPPACSTNTSTIAAAKTPIQW